MFTLPVRGEFIRSGGNRCLVQPATVLLPAIRGKTCRRPRSTRIRQAAGPDLRTDSQGQTILHDVIANDFGDGPGDGVVVARMLLDAGARTDIRDHLLK